MQTLRLWSNTLSKRFATNRTSIGKLSIFRPIVLFLQKKTMLRVDNFDDFTDRLSRTLCNNLPGFEAQDRMSPSIRTHLMGTCCPNSLTQLSAVLILLFPTCNGISTLLIKRPTYDGIHSGQVCLPGGKVEPEDESIIATALREAHEEVGINPTDITVIGQLTPLFIPVSNSMVTPVVGISQTAPTLQINPREVDYAFQVELENLADPNRIKTKNFTTIGRSVTAPYFDVSNETVWGATAMIIAELIAILELPE